MHAPATNRERKTARQRAWRRRQASGERIAHIPVDPVAVAETLVAAHLLRACEVDNVEKVDQALAAAIKHWTTM
jgi:hypothetical protein